MFASVLAPVFFRPFGWSQGTDATGANTTETVLKSSTIPANFFATLGRRINFQYTGSFGANANLKTVRLRLGAVTLTGDIIAVTSSTAYNNLNWKLEGTIQVRALPDSQSCEWIFYSDGGAVTTALQAGQGSAVGDDASALLLELTGQNGAAAANDIVCYAHKVDMIFGSPQVEE